MLQSHKIYLFRVVLSTKEENPISFNSLHSPLAGSPLAMMSIKVYLVLFLVIIKNNIALDVGEECVPNNNVSNGICTEVTKCEIALKAIRETYRHPFLRCSFEGEIEIVCCPQETTTTDTKFDPDDRRIAERVSERECRNIMESSTPPLDLHIIGGEISSIGEFPHMVAIGYENENGYQFDCGGALVSTTFVLTAAHCVINLERKYPKIIRAGVVELGDEPFNEQSDYRVVQNITHPEYKRSAQYHDIALLRLERPIDVSSNLNAACLYTNTADPTGNLTITGWGRTSTTRSDKSRMLLKTTVWSVSQEQCSPHYRNWRKLPRGVAPGQLCAGDPRGGHDACQGDSGGPLQLTIGREAVYRLAGVTSFGRGCGSTLPGIYTRVAAYLDWIESVVWPN